MKPIYVNILRTQRQEQVHLYTIRTNVPEQPIQLQIGTQILYLHPLRGLTLRVK